MVATDIELMVKTEIEYYTRLNKPKPLRKTDKAYATSRNHRLEEEINQETGYDS